MMKKQKHEKTRDTSGLGYDIMNISQTAQQVDSSPIRKMFNIASNMEDVVNLGIGEPDFDTPPNIVEAARKALSAGITHYTANAGTRELRTVAAEKLRTENGIATDPEKEIIITTGAMGGLFLAIQVLIDRGDEVILPTPIWPNYANQIVMAGGIPVYLQTDSSQRYLIDPERLSAVVTPRTKAILINTPGNPTGAVLSRQNLETVAEIAQKHNLFVLSDEVYEYFIWEGAEHVSIGSIPGMKERTITINSLSKAYSMTGWRVGYTAAPATVTAEMIKLQENVYACVNSIAQAAAVEALTGTRKYLNVMIEEYRKRRSYMLETLTAIQGLDIISPSGAFYMVAELDPPWGAHGSEDFALRLLKQSRVATIPGTAFGKSGRDYLRISYAANMSELRKSVVRIQQFMGSESFNG
jgi:aminotransferase